MSDLVQRTVERIYLLLKSDPLMFSHLKLDIETILRLRRFPLLTEVYCLHFHPVSLVEIVGFIVTRNMTSRTVNYTVDDSTGLLPCVMFESDDRSRSTTARKLNNAVSVADHTSTKGRSVGDTGAVAATTNPDARAEAADVVRPAMFSVGMLVRVQGKLSEFRGERQLKIYRIAQETDVDIEALQWLQMLQNAHSMYSVVNEQRKREVLELYSKLNVKDV